MQAIPEISHVFQELSRVLYRNRVDDVGGISERRRRISSGHDMPRKLDAYSHKQSHHDEERTETETYRFYISRYNGEGE